VSLPLALLITGCLFGESLEVLVFEADGGRFVSISTTSTWLPCDNSDDSSSFTCTYFSEDDLSNFSLSALELLFTLLIYDPLVLQVLEEARGFQASYSVQGGGGGALEVRSGLSSIRVDTNRTLQAEPGMQLVVLDFPAGAPTSGTGGFNLNFRIPNDLDALNMKAVFTGKVTIDEENYYLPLYPCTSDMAALPTLNVPLPNGGLVTLPVESVQGCDNEVYTFTPAQNDFDNTLLLPRLGK
jgi:hypothetical protein